MRIRKILRNYIPVAVTVGLLILLSTWFSEKKEEPICYCEDEEFCFPTLTKIGRPFPCRLLPLLQKYSLTSDVILEQQKIVPEDVVFVTYASADHYSESRRMINNLRKIFPKNRIIYYDLGLESRQVTELRKLCHLDYHLLPTEYSDYPIQTFVFKIIVMLETSMYYHNFWILDSSVNFYANVDHFYEEIDSHQREPFALGLYAHHSIYAATNPGIYKYLPIAKDESRSYEMMEANLIFVSMSNFSRNLLKWLSLCALTEGCMHAPRWSRNCDFRDVVNRYDQYRECHRFDQSAMNILLYHALNESPDYRKRHQFESFAKVDRTEFDGDFTEEALCKS